MFEVDSVRHINGDPSPGASRAISRETRDLCLPLHQGED
jgi:hypothetical protein